MTSRRLVRDQGDPLTAYASTPRRDSRPRVYPETKGTRRQSQIDVRSVSRAGAADSAIVRILKAIVLLLALVGFTQLAFPSGLETVQDYVSQIRLPEFGSVFKYAKIQHYPSIPAAPKDPLVEKLYLETERLALKELGVPSTRELPSVEPDLWQFYTAERHQTFTNPLDQVKNDLQKIDFAEAQALLDRSGPNNTRLIDLTYLRHETYSCQGDVYSVQLLDASLRWQVRDLKNRIGRDAFSYDTKLRFQTPFLNTSPANWAAIKIMKFAGYEMDLWFMRWDSYLFAIAEQARGFRSKQPLLFDAFVAKYETLLKSFAQHKESAKAKCRREFGPGLHTPALSACLANVKNALNQPSNALAELKAMSHTHDALRNMYEILEVDVEILRGEVAVIRRNLKLGSGDVREERFYNFIGDLKTKIDEPKEK